MTPSPTTTPPQILSPEELAVWLGDRGFHASVEFVREALRDGALPGYKVRGRWAIPEALLSRWEAGLWTVFDPSFLRVLEAVEAGQIQTAVPASAVPIKFVGRRAA